MQKYYQTTLRLWKLLKPFHKHFYLQLFLIVISQTINILIVLSISKILNNIVDKLFIIAVYFALSWFTLKMINVWIDYIKSKHENVYLKTKIQQYLEEYSFKNVFKLNASQYLEDHSAIKLQVINRGKFAIENIISTFILSLIPTFTQVIFSIAAIAYYSPLVALICSITFITSIIWTNYFTNYHRPFVRKNIENWDTQRKVRTEAFQHLSLIKVSGVEKSYLRKYLENRSSYLDFSIETFQKGLSHSYKRWIWFTTGRVASIFVIIYQSFLGQLLIGNIYAIWTWLNDAFNNISTVIQAMRTIPINFVELEKYLNIVDREPEFNESGDRKFVSGNIVFKNLNFKYPKGEKYIFENLNLEIEQGKKTAFVGFSGSGKSTIIKLLLRIYDWESGDIKIGGKTLHEMDSRILRQKIGYVEQHVDLFDTTIRENILFGMQDKNLSETDLEQVIEKSRIDQFAHRLGSTGLDTIIGERGVKLSGGERQRIGIARALVKNPEILIFDEATASLDTENEKYIQEAIDKSGEGRTTIVIAHRLSTVQNADKIYVMDKGEVVGVGTHESLKEENEIYQRLIKAQSN